ncbi:MAG: putative T7SS-secreted protein [Mycobacteriales bacterium]
MPPDGEWYPLDRDRNPIPGDPDKVREYASYFQQTHDRITQHNSTFRGWKAADAEWEGEAAKAYDNKMTDLPEKLDKVAKRFGGIAEALNAYYPKLDAAQSKALGALNRARAAVQSRNETNRKYPATQAKPAGQPDTEQDKTNAKNRQAGLDHADSELRGAKQTLQEAESDRDNAANEAAGRIVDVCDDDLKNPSGWKAFLDGLRKVLNVISTVANALATVFGVLALVFCWVPGLNAILGGLALAFSVIALVADLGLLAYGDKNGWDILVDALGVLPFGKIAKVAGLAKLGRAGRLIRAASGRSPARLASALSEARGMERGFKLSEGLKGFAKGLNPREMVGDFTKGIDDFKNFKNVSATGNVFQRFGQRLGDADHGFRNSEFGQMFKAGSSVAETAARRAPQLDVGNWGSKAVYGTGLGTDVLQSYEGVRNDDWPPGGLKGGGGAGSIQTVSTWNWDLSPKSDDYKAWYTAR